MWEERIIVRTLDDVNMELRRYVRKEGAEPMYFGPHRTRHTWDFEWFYSAHKPGGHTLETELIMQGRKANESRGTMESEHTLIQKIGASGVPMAPDDCVMKNLWVGEEPIVLAEYATPPFIYRVRPSKERLHDTSGAKEVGWLIKFLKENKVVYLYRATTGLRDEKKRLVPNITTFSLHPPHEEQYRYHSTIPIVLEGRRYGPSLSTIFSYLPFWRKREGPANP